MTQGYVLVSSLWCLICKNNGSPAGDAADAAVAAVAAAPVPPPALPQESISGADSSHETLQKHNSIEPPMKLPEVQAAAEHALLTSISDETLRTALSSVEGFEVRVCIFH